MTMRSPRPAVFFTSCLCRPVPKASMRLMATVPHTMPKTVRNVRNFSARTSRISWGKTSFRVTMMWSRGLAVAESRGAPRPRYLETSLRNLLRRPLDDLIALLQSRQHFHVEAIRNAGLDLDLLRLALRRGAGDLPR